MEIRDENPWVGEVIDGYEITKQIIGKGGMGSIYLAHHKEMDRKAAAKFLPLPCGDSTAQRFVREAKAHQRLDGIPNVGRLYHFVTSHKNKPCYVLFLELFEKPAVTLDDYITLYEDLSKPDLQIKLVKMYMKIAYALGQAQQLKDRDGNPMPVIHRDLKPGNIMILNPKGRELDPRIIDWGLARIKMQAELTSSQLGMGTPLFMPPEQFQTPDEVDFRSDIYALGLCYFRTRTGQYFCPNIDYEDEATVIVAKVTRFLQDSQGVKERLRMLPLPERACLEPMLLSDRIKRPDGWWEVVGLFRGILRYHQLRKSGETIYHGVFERVDDTNEDSVPVSSSQIAGESGTGNAKQRRVVFLMLALIALIFGCTYLVWRFGFSGSKTTVPVVSASEMTEDEVDEAISELKEEKAELHAVIEATAKPKIEEKSTDPFEREFEWCEKNHKHCDSFDNTPTLHAWCIRNRAITIRKEGVEEDNLEKLKESLEILKEMRQKFCIWQKIRWDKNLGPQCEKRFPSDIRRTKRMIADLKKAR